VTGPRFTDCGHFTGSIVPCAEAEQARQYCQPETIQEVATTTAGCCGTCALNNAPGLRGGVQKDAAGVAEPQQQDTVPQNRQQSAQHAGSHNIHQQQGQAHRSQHVPKSEVTGTASTVASSTVASPVTGLTTGSQYSENPARKLQQDAELYEAQTQAALQASHHYHQQHENVLVRRALERSLRDVEKENQESLHKAKLESFKSLAEELSQQHGRTAGSSQRSGTDTVLSAETGRSTTTPRRAVPSTRVATSTAAPTSSSSNVSSSIPGSSILHVDLASGSRGVRSGASTLQPSPAATQAYEQTYAMPQATIPTPPQAGYDWTRPPEQCRSPSPTITINRAWSQQGQEDQRRRDMYEARQASCEGTASTISTDQQSKTSRSSRRTKK